MTPIDGTTGKIPEGRIAIIASRYNASICDAMVDGAWSALMAAGVVEKRVLLIRVPGAWELCLAVEKVFHHADVIAAIALGTVIKGETSHDHHINRAVSQSLMEQSVRSGRPIGFGLLTCNTVEQAIQRSGGNVGNKGEETALAVLEMLRLESNLAR